MDYQQRKIDKIIDSIRDTEHFKQALTHSSYCNESSSSVSYERLEFLGDEVLNFYTSLFIFHPEHRQKNKRAQNHGNKRDGDGTIGIPDQPDHRHLRCPHEVDQNHQRPVNDFLCIQITQRDLYLLYTSRNVLPFCNSRLE